MNLVAQNYTQEFQICYALDYRLQVVSDIGLLCKLEPAGERSSRCLFVTEKQGKLWTTAFNASQTKSQLRGLLIPPVLLELELSKSKSQYYNLSGAQEIDLYPKVKSKLPLNSVAQYLLEVLIETSFYDQSEQTILQLTVNTLKALERGSDARVMLFSYIWRTLGLHYAMPDFNSDRFAKKHAEISLILNLIKMSWIELSQKHFEEVFNDQLALYNFWLMLGNTELEDYIEHKLNSFRFALQQLV